MSYPKNIKQFVNLENHYDLKTYKLFYRYSIFTPIYVEGKLLRNKKLARKSFVKNILKNLHN